MTKLFTLLMAVGVLLAPTMPNYCEVQGKIMAEDYSCVSTDFYAE